MRRHVFAGIIAGFLVMCIGAGQVSATVDSKKKVAASGWNVVLVITDDQPIGTLSAMPHLNRLLVDKGVNFTNAVVPTSLCCPSRTSLFTGKLATQTGVYTNESDTGYGGYPAFKGSGLENDTIATALDGAGYNTAYFGKFLNEYGPLYDGTAPPGWDTWRVFTTQQSGKYRNFSLSDAVPAGQNPKRARQEFVSKYSTTYLGKQAAEYIRNAPASLPLFTVYAPYAPHSPFTAAKKYAGRNDVPANYRNPSIMESDVSDKPAYVQQAPLTDTVEGSAPGENLAKQMDTLGSVDDQVRELYRAVKASGRLSNTLFVFMSDNGYLHGEHRLDGKGYPYLKSTNVPLIMRWGGGSQPTQDDRLTIANVDVSATILTAAGLPNTTSGTPVSSDRNLDGVPLVAVESTSRVVRPPFCGWRTREELFVRYGSGEEEFYDYRVDPYEMSNLIDSSKYAARIDQLRQLARQACDPAPPGFGPDFDLPRWHPVRGGTAPPYPDSGSDKVNRA